jgi:iron(III) transport system ATP-binding protein
MAIADRITLLNAGTIEQEGKPIELYTAPKSLFTAEFMGSNNRLPGKLKEKFGERAALMVEGIRLDGMLRCATTIGGDAIGVIRLERVRIADGPGANRIPMTLQTQMYLGERWELVFSRGALSVRVYAPAPLPAGEHQVEFPADALWVF